MKNIITISGDPSSGKSTCVKRLKERLEEEGYDVKVISVGQIFRKEATKRGISINELIEPLENAGSNDMDRYIERSIAKLGQEIEEKNEENCIYIIDSRMGWWCIPNSFKVLLKTNSKIAGERIFYDTSRGKEDSYSTLEEAIRSTEERKLIDIKRYKNKYGVDIADINNYDLVIDTSYAEPEDVHQCVDECFRNYRENQHYNKLWTSPRTLLPLQSIKDTVPSKIEKIEKSIKENGFDQSYPIEILEVNNLPFIFEGHHRNYGAYMAGKTLVPYIVLARDDENIPFSKGTAKERVMPVFQSREYSSCLYDYENIFFSKHNECKINPETGMEYIDIGNYGIIYGNDIYSGKSLSDNSDSDGR